MDTSDIQKKCEQFLQSLAVPGFIVIGLQTEPANAQVVYSINKMPLKGVVKALTHTLNDLMGRM